MQTTIIVATHKPYWVPEDPMYLPVQMGHAIHPAIGYIGDDTGENISERNANFCELTGLYWAAHNIDSDYIGIVHYRRYFASRKKSRFAPKKDRVISHEELCSILATTNVVLPRERHYFIETNYTQYIHAGAKQAGAFWKGVDPCPEAGEQGGKLVVGNTGEKRRGVERREKFFHKKFSFVENSTDLLLLV